MLKDYYNTSVEILRKSANTVDDGGIPVENYLPHITVKAHIENKQIDNKLLYDKTTIKILKRMICDISDITTNDIAVIDGNHFEIKTVNPIMNRLMEIDIMEK